MNTHYVKNPKSEPTDKPFPTPDEIESDEIRYYSRAEVLKAYTALHAAYEAKCSELSADILYKALAQRLITRILEATDGDNADIELRLVVLISQNKELQQQLDAMVGQRIEQSKRIAELEHRTTRFRK